MNARERFRATCRFEAVDRPFRWETIGFWPETTARWHTEGLPADVDGYLTSAYFDMDLRIPIFVGDHEDPGLFPRFEEQILEETPQYRVRRNPAGITLKEFKHQQSALPEFLAFPVTDMRSFEAIRDRLDPATPDRLGTDWAERARAYRDVEVPLFVYVSGLFGCARHLLGFENLMAAYIEMPDLVHAIGEQWTTLTGGILEEIAAATTVDVVYLWEDMAYRNGPMIGPRMFREFMTPYYTRVLDRARAAGIDVFEVDSDGDCNLLIPLFLEAGVNMFLPFEVQAGMDVREVRQRFGTRLAIEGGLDKRVLALDPGAIRAEVDAKVPLLLRDGGYIPAIDHQVPPDVSMANFEYYLQYIRDVGERCCRP